MKNKKEPLDINNPMEMFEVFTKIMLTPDFGGMFDIFGGKPFNEKDKYPHEILGNGYELRNIEMKDSNGDIIDNREAYSHLYHNDLKVSDEVFRKGMGGAYKDGYCSLIHYTQKEPHTEKRHGFDFGKHVIINEVGDIVLGQNSGFDLDYPSHIGGHLGSIGNYIYNLLTGEAIAPKSSGIIKGVNCIIIEHQYDWYNKEVELPLGIYKIDFKTVEITKIDEVK